MSEKFVEESKKWHVFRTASCFNRRVTCIEWQPDYPHLVAFGSHGGDIQLFNTLDSKDEKFIKGVSSNTATDLLINLMQNINVS